MYFEKLVGFPTILSILVLGTGIGIVPVPVKLDV
jgi:hypothetical protein